MASPFNGFQAQQRSVGVMFGWPTTARYIQWLSWRTNWYTDFGYQFDGYVVGAANYSYYFLTEEDKWRSQGRVGTVMFSIMGGVFAGVSTDKDNDEDALLALRVGGALDYLLPNSRWTLRAEVAPVLFLSGNTTAGVQGAVGLIYHFGQPGSSGRLKKSTKPSQKGKS